MCDLVRRRRARRASRITEAKVGRGAPWAAPLPWLVPPARRAASCCSPATRSTPARAYEIGLVNQVVTGRPSSTTSVQELAEPIAANAPLSVRAAKAMVYRVAVGRSADAYASADAIWEPVYRSEDAQEGPRAFRREAPAGVEGTLTCRSRWTRSPTTSSRDRGAAATCSTRSPTSSGRGRRQRRAGRCATRSATSRTSTRPRCCRPPTGRLRGAARPAEQARASSAAPTSGARSTATCRPPSCRPGSRGARAELHRRVPRARPVGAGAVVRARHERGRRAHRADHGDVGPRPGRRRHRRRASGRRPRPAARRAPRRRARCPTASARRGRPVPDVAGARRARPRPTATSGTWGPPDADEPRRPGPRWTSAWWSRSAVTSTTPASWPTDRSRPSGWRSRRRSPGRPAPAARRGHRLMRDDPAGPASRNCSGFYGDRLAAPREMLDGPDPIDVLTGDYLAELTMLILGKAQPTRPDGRATRATFLRQMEDVLGDVPGARHPDRRQRRRAQPGRARGGPARARRAARGDAAGRARRGRRPADRLAELQAPASTSRISTPVCRSRSGVEPVTANAYLGGWGIAAALEAGADVVVTGRVTDASLVVGPAAWWHGWARDDWDALAGAVVAGPRHRVRAAGAPAATTRSSTSSPTRLPGLPDRRGRRRRLVGDHQAPGTGGLGHGGHGHRAAALRDRRARVRRTPTSSRTSTRSGWRRTGATACAISGVRGERAARHAQGRASTTTAATATR